MKAGEAMFRLDQLLKVIDPAPVMVDHGACLQARHQRSECHFCIVACPHQALSSDERRITADPALCTRCGLCAGACPTGAVSIRGINQEAVLAAGEVRCNEVTGSGTQLPCLGWLTPDHLVAMALRHGKVALVCGDCEACRWARGGSMAAGAVAAANGALAALGRAADVTMGRPEARAAAAAQRAVSRRELLALWSTETSQIAKELLPAREVNPAQLPARVPARRSAWVKRAEPEKVQPGAHLPSETWKARTVSDACNGCGVCAAFCPTGAFAQSRSEEGWALAHQPAACVACGACVELCPVGAIGEEAPAAADMAQGTVREVARRVKKTCTICRRPFTGRSGDTACSQCKTLAGMLGI
jgi:ferredoxin